MRLRSRLAAFLLVVLLGLPGFSLADSSLAGQSERKPDSPSSHSLAHGQAGWPGYVASASAVEQPKPPALRIAPDRSPVEASPAERSDAGAGDASVEAGQPASTGGPSVEASNKELSEQQTAEELHATLSMVLTAREHLMLELIDQQRNQVGLGRLELDDTMIELARFRSQDMASQNYFSHVAPDGSSARDLMVAARIGPGLMGEILGRNNSADSVESVQSVVDAFMKSPDHRDAIVNHRFVTAGVGAATGSDGMSYYAVLFFGP